MQIETLHRELISSMELKVLWMEYLFLSYMYLHFHDPLDLMSNYELRFLLDISNVSYFLVLDTFCNQSNISIPLLLDMPTCTHVVLVHATV